MTLADRVAVPAGITEIVLRNDIIRDGIAKWAGHARLIREKPRALTKIIFAFTARPGRTPIGCGWNAGVLRQTKTHVNIPTPANTDL